MKNRIFLLSHSRAVIMFWSWGNIHDFTRIIEKHGKGKHHPKHQLCLAVALTLELRSHLCVTDVWLTSLSSFKKLKKETFYSHFIWFRPWAHVHQVSAKKERCNRHTNKQVFKKNWIFTSVAEGPGFKSQLELWIFSEFFAPHIIINSISFKLSLTPFSTETFN